MALHLFPIHFVEGYFLSLLIWNADIIILLIHIRIWVCRVLITEGLWFPPTCPHSWYSLSESMLLPRIVLDLYINFRLISESPNNDSAYSCWRLAHWSIYLSLSSWGYFNLFFIYFYFVWFFPRDFILFGCCYSWESFSSIILSNQLFFAPCFLNMITLYFHIFPSGKR